MAVMLSAAKNPRVASCGFFAALSMTAEMIRRGFGRLLLPIWGAHLAHCFVQDNAGCHGRVKRFDIVCQGNRNGGGGSLARFRRWPVRFAARDEGEGGAQILLEIGVWAACFGQQ